jgi:AraC family transcriptional regulator of adaptative response / DNA-3-methyladenine glycosylase II
MSDFRRPRGVRAGSIEHVLVDTETAYRAVAARDTRFDGCFITAVRTTRIYCRPSCPAMTPKRRNVEFFPTAAAAQAAGYRACRRCLPDAVPGSPEWNVRADLAGRAMRLIADGLVEREGVPGLARRVGYSERQLTRVLTQELGAGPLALARAYRAQAARVLVETTDLSFSDIAFAAGFASVRQFNDTVREIYAANPSEMRLAARRRPNRTPATAGRITLRLAYRPPLDAAGLLAFLAARAVPGVEEVTDGSYARTMRLPHGAATAHLTPSDGHVQCTLHLADQRDLGSAVARLRRLLDLDADPTAVDELLATDPALAASVAAAPGIRLPAWTAPRPCCGRCSASRSRCRRPAPPPRG